MVTFNEFMSIGMEQCAPSGRGSQAARRQTFADLADVWNREKDEIRSMSGAEVRQNLTCP